MDFSLSEEQEMLKAAGRDFLEKECPLSLIREMEEDETGYPPDLWHKIAGLGWLGLPFPTEYGGSGGSFLDLAILLEEMGRALVPGPFVSTVVHCGLSILEAGTEEQKTNLLPGITQGETILATALTELSGLYTAEGVEARAVLGNGNYIVSGTKMFVPSAHVAQYLLTAVRTENGITLLLIDAKSPGITYTPLRTIASDKQFEVVFDEVPVPQANVLGQPDNGWPIVEQILRRAAVAECAMMLGGARRVLEMTLDYARERVQYGKPIGSFQAVQHKCVDMMTDVEGARHLTYQAAWKLSEGFPCSMEVSMAKAWSGAASSRTCAQACHLHGAIGYTWDHDLQLFLRRIKASELVFGDATFHEEIVAQQLGL